MIILKKLRGQCHSDPKLIGSTWPSEVVPHTKFETPTSKNMDFMPILETRSEVKVTVTGKWNPKMQPHTKFGIPSSNNIK